MPKTKVKRLILSAAADQVATDRLMHIPGLIESRGDRIHDSHSTDLIDECMGISSLAPILDSICNGPQSPGFYLVSCTFTLTHFHRSPTLLHTEVQRNERKQASINGDTSSKSSRQLLPEVGAFPNHFLLLHHGLQETALGRFFLDCKPSHTPCVPCRSGPLG